MGLFDSPRLFFVLRAIQLAFALGFLVVLAYSNQHHGRWYKLEGPVALGVVSFIFTLFITLHAIWEYVKKSYSISGKVFLIVRAVLEFLVFLMWIGSATLLLRPRQLDPANWWKIAPEIPWDVAIAFSFVEIVVFFMTTVLVVVQMRNGGPGGTHSASYV